MRITRSLARGLGSFSLLALDAPLVAAAWYALAARWWVGSVRLSCLAVLVLSVWLVYAADRWLDGRQLSAPEKASPRHRVAQRRGRSWIALWALVLAVDLTLAATQLSEEDLRWGALLLSLVALYLALVRLPARWRVWLPKELLVGLIFSAGVHLFVWTSSELGEEVTGDLADVGWWFAAVCWLDCQLISLWEVRLDEEQSMATRSGGVGGRAALLLALALLGGGLLVAGPSWMLRLPLLATVCWLVGLAAATRAGAAPAWGRALVDLGLALPAFVGWLVLASLNLGGA
jgi:hypothetical protein